MLWFCAVCLCYLQFCPHFLSSSEPSSGLLGVGVLLRWYSMVSQCFFPGEKGASGETTTNARSLPTGQSSHSPCRPNRKGRKNVFRSWAFVSFGISTSSSFSALLGWCPFGGKASALDSGTLCLTSLLHGIHLLSRCTTARHRRSTTSPRTTGSIYARRTWSRARSLRYGSGRRRRSDSSGSRALRR